MSISLVARQDFGMQHKSQPTGQQLVGLMSRMQRDFSISNLLRKRCKTGRNNRVVCHAMEVRR